MHEIILHHYAFSTFSEKIRIALGIKELAWRSVEIPGLPPRPLLSPLSGRYRRAPVMQVGANIYCDTHMILSALDRMHPQARLVHRAEEGLIRGLGFAWERQLWIPTIGVLVHYIGDHIPEEFLRDRKEGYLGVDISRQAMAPQFEENVQFVRAQVSWLAKALKEQSFLFGEQPSAADLACWQTIFLLRKNCPPEVDRLLGFEAIEAWVDRIAAFGHGTQSPLSAEEAFGVASSSKPEPPAHMPANGDPGGLRDGTLVSVTPEDNARIPVVGTLVAASADEVVIHRVDEAAGALHIHFPRLGYTVLAQP